MSQFASWADVNVAYGDHPPSGKEIENISTLNTLDVALLPVQRASWRVDGGTTTTGRIVPGTTSIRAARTVVWSRWEQTCKCIHVGLSQSLLDQIARDVGAGAAVLDYCEGVHDPLVLQCALALAEEAGNGGLAGELYVQSIANILAVHTLRRFGGIGFADERSGQRLVGAKLQRAKDFIEAHLEQQLSLDRIANAAALSPYHFARSFKEATGLPPHRYVIQRRIELAKLLLLSTGLPIADVARRVGMPNQSHFTAHFRRLVGCSPKEFRNGP